MRAVLRSGFVGNVRDDVNVTRRLRSNQLDGVVNVNVECAIDLSFARRRFLMIMISDS